MVIFHGLAYDAAAGDIDEPKSAVSGGTRWSVYIGCARAVIVE